ncbi:MAG: tol-pal system protein YbgF [Aquabacterium sp.]|nr:tol-pal system protein YbgF [Aquabacterium sp.]
MPALQARSLARAVRVCAISVATLWGLHAQAGLFDDDEARKAILDLRARLTASEEAARKSSAEQAATNAQLLEQVQQLRRSLLELNSQLEAQRAELARLRGHDEQLLRDVAELQQRLKDGSQGLDERLRRLEPQQVAVDGRNVTVEPDEKRAYEEALAVLRAGEFDKAAVALAAFIKRHPASGLLDSARFWLGNAQYGRRDYREAIASFRSLIVGSPDHPRVPEALLAVANCQVETKDVKGARRTLDELIKRFPGSEAAGAARERLASLKG